jgi:DNA-binding LacI/PurR family transcriptional regulator
MDPPPADHLIEWLAGTGLPVVLLERTAAVGPHHAFLESVVTDHALGATMAVHHLVGLGHRKVGVVLAGPSPATPHVNRVAQHTYQPSWRPGFNCQLSARLIVNVTSLMVTGWIT